MLDDKRTRLYDPEKKLQGDPPVFIEMRMTKEEKTKIYRPKRN